MAINNSDCIVEWDEGVVYETRVEQQEDFSIDNTGKRTITVQRSLIAEQTAEKQDIAATDAYAAIIAPFQIEGFAFYVTDLNLRRVNHVYGTRQARVGSSMVPVSRWTCSVTYETATRASQERQEGSTKKTDQYPVITWTSNRFDMATTADVFGSSYRNSAGDFYEGISRPAEERVYSVTLNSPVRSPDDPNTDLITVFETIGGELVPKSPRVISQEIAALDANAVQYEPNYTKLFNYTNNAPVIIRGQYWDVNTLRVSAMQVGELQIDQNEVYFEVNYTLIGRPWGWHREVANRGMNELEYVVPRGLFGDSDFHADPNSFHLRDLYKHYNKPYSEIIEILNTKYGTSFVNQQDQWPEVTDYIIEHVVSKRKVAITDEKGRVVPQPVFLDGWGQAQRSTGIVPGTLGDMTVTSGSKIGTTSINVLAYLGAKILVEGFDKPLYVPQTRIGLYYALRSAGMDSGTAKAVKDTDVTSWGYLPLTFALGERKYNKKTNDYEYVGVKFFTAPAGEQLDLLIAPGITTDYQDYYGADLTALPGVYPVP